MATVLNQRPTTRPKVSIDEYLDREWAAEQGGGRKAEYVAGEVREMPGGTWRHGLLIGNLTTELSSRLEGRPFGVVPTEIRVRVSAGGPYYYPDVVVAPVPPQILEDRGETLLDPVVLFEVLSPSTAEFDRGEKLANYTKMATLRDYVIVAQDSVRVDHFSRQEDGYWRVLIFESPEQKLTLPAVGVEVPLSRIYRQVISAPE